MLISLLLHCPTPAPAKGRRFRYHTADETEESRGKAMKITGKIGFCAALLGSSLWPVYAAARAADPRKPAAGKTESKDDSAAKGAKDPSMSVEKATSPLDFTVKDIDGKDVPLSKYKGSVVMIVNVA